MTRKHFEALADALRHEHPLFTTDTSAARLTWNNVVSSIADTCEAFNPNFDRDRFIRAAYPKGL